MKETNTIRKSVRLETSKIQVMISRKVLTMNSETLSTTLHYSPNLYNSTIPPALQEKPEIPTPGNPEP